MRIGLLTTSFPRFEGDVAGLFVLGFARALAARGHTVQVLAPEPPRLAEPPGWRGVQVRWVPYLRPRALQRTFYGAGVPDNLLRDPRAWLGLGPFPLALARATRRAMPHWDAVVSHWALPCALVAGRERGDRPHLAVLHSADVHALSRMPARARIAERIAASSTALLFSSTALRASFLGWLPPLPRAEVAGRAHVCPMGIDPPAPPEQPRPALRERLGLARTTLLALGRLVPIKGLDDAIRAVAGRDDVELVIAGEGPARQRIAQLARELRAPVRLVGVVRGADKAAWLAAADAFVAPSRTTRTGRTEGTPTAVLEALAAGLPVIGTAHGGLARILQDGGNALVVGERDPGAIARAVDRLVADRDLRRRLGRAARRTGRLYLWTEIAPHLEALLSGAEA